MVVFEQCKYRDECILEQVLGCYCCNCSKCHASHGYISAGCSECQFCIEDHKGRLEE